MQSNLDDDNELKVLGKEDSERLSDIVRDCYRRRRMSKSENDDINILVVRYVLALRKMAIDAQGSKKILRFWIYNKLYFPDLLLLFQNGDSIFGYFHV